MCILIAQMKQTGMKSGTYFFYHPYALRRQKLINLICTIEVLVIFSIMRNVYLKMLITNHCVIDGGHIVPLAYERTVSLSENSLYNYHMLMSMYVYMIKDTIILCGL